MPICSYIFCMNTGNFQLVWVGSVEVNEHCVGIAKFLKALKCGIVWFCEGRNDVEHILIVCFKLECYGYEIILV